MRAKQEHLRHLVIGAGNMGRKHGGILTLLGDSVDYIDVGVDPLIQLQKQRYNSVLICTPADTHSDLINTLFSPGIPVFCEKPVVTHKSELNYPQQSMVACNWRFCQHVIDATKITCVYPQLNKLDLIHFVDLFWEQYGQPLKAEISKLANGWRLALQKDTAQHLHRRTYTILENAETFTVVDGMPIHSGQCRMFIEQMIKWRAQVRRRASAENPIEKALIRTCWLLEKLNA